MPCVHVRDVARLARVVASDDSLGSYLVAVDHARLTQQDIVQGIIDQISHKREVSGPQMASNGHLDTCC